MNNHSVPDNAHRLLVKNPGRNKMKCKLLAFGVIDSVVVVIISVVKFGINR
ncbi:hypothetical protein HanIR_Chr06g0276401 [Helianthus annuus]|nr:hypothetical protein HanIR_Chr06g0276401 [Helianthus annuus]